MIEVPRIAMPKVLRILIEMDQSGAVTMEAGDPRSIPINGALGPVHPLIVASITSSVLTRLLEQVQKGTMRSGQENHSTVKEGS